MTKRVYLAGPEVFLLDAREIRARKGPSVSGRACRSLSRRRGGGL